MKKILAISMVLVLMLGAAFATNQAEANIITSVAAGDGLGDALDNAVIGDGSTYGFIITYGDNDSTAISSEDYTVTGKSAATEGNYTFNLKYIGKEANGEQHTVKAECDGWFLSTTTFAAAASYQKNAITVTSSVPESTGNASISSAAASTAATITTTFGSSTTQAPVTTAVQVGTFKLDWDDASSLQVGTYKANVTFTITGA